MNNKVVSHFGWDIDDVRKLDVIAQMRNDWRQRNVTVYQHPIDPMKVVTIGESFNADMNIFITEESKFEWLPAINVFPKTYVFK